MPTPRAVIASGAKQSRTQPLPLHRTGVVSCPMACCKARQYFGWCENEETVPASDGKEYCVFHAPKGEKGISLKEFNELVISRIREAKGLNKSCNLSGTIFEGDISFREFKKDNPLPEISFEHAIFSGKADFYGATFDGFANFGKATFSGEASFTWATFGGTAVFGGATFGDEADFRRVTFGNEAYFDGATFGRVLFSLATFGGLAHFHETTFRRRATFWGLVFGDKGSLRFAETHLGNVFFLRTDMKRLDFANCKWDRRFGRDVLYNEMVLRLGEDYVSRPATDWFGRATELFYDSFQYVLSSFRLLKKGKAEKVERVYNSLKQKYKAEHNEPRVSDWHFGEKEMQRKKHWYTRYNPVGLSNLYWLSSGYGERPFRAGIMMGILILAASALLARFGGLVPFDPVNHLYEIVVVGRIGGLADVFTDCEKFVAVVLNTLQYVTFQKETVFKPSTLLGGYIKMASQILVALQAALFALAVRNRFRR